MKVSPRIIPGSLCAANKYACDWGWQGLLAYGCNSFVVVFDSKITQIIQTLHHHQHPAAIVRVRWARDKFNHDVNSPYKLKLAAANQAGHVMIWDVVSAELLNEFSEPGKPVLEMYWMHRTEVFIGCLLVLFSPGLLVLQNTETGAQMWRKSFHDPLISFALDPFDLHSAAVMSQDWIMFLHGLHPSSPPSEQSKKFYITSNSSRGTGPGGAVPNPMKTSGTSKSAFAKMKSWAGDIRGRNDEENLSSDCLEIAYSPTNKGHFLMLFPREILILDLEFGQAVGSFTVDINSPSFLQIIPCKYRDAFFCLHDNGSITLKLRRPPEAVPYNQGDSLVSSRFPPDIYYDAKCHSDVFRLSRLCRIMCFSVCPRSEKEVALVLSDGRLLFWELASEPQIKTVDHTTARDLSLSLAEMIPPPVQFHGSSRQLKNQLKIKFQLSKMYNGIAPNPTCLKMCPSLTTKNWAVYKPMAAVGNASGIVQFVRVDIGAVLCEFAVHSSAVKGLEWINLSVLLSFAHSSSGSAKSEIQMIDRLTGLVCALPTSRGLQESYIAAIKLSYLRQYFVAIYKNQHAELWDAKTMIQLREFPANSPLVTALEWTPAYYSSKGKKKNAAHSKGDFGIGADNAGAVLENTRKTDQKKVYTKEDLAFTNPEGHIFHYIIEGTSIKEGSRVPPEVGMGAISQIAWKDELLMCGDVLGNVNVWDLKHRKSRNFETGRSGVKRMKFAPGKSHMRLLILCGDGVVCWEQADSPTVTLGIKTKKDHPEILDADWLSSDIPLLLYSDGSLRAMDESFKDTNCPLEKKCERDYAFSPRFLPPSPQMLLRTLLESQSWNSEYDLDFRDILDSEALKHLGARKFFPGGVLKRLLEPKHGTAERCRTVSLLFGDEFGFEFWTVALYYLQKEKGTRSCNKHKGMDYANKRRSSYKDVVYADGTKGIQRTESDTGVSSLDMSATGESDSQKSPAECTCFDGHLDSCFDVLCDNEFYQALQLYNIAIKDGKRLTPEQSRICARKMILAGETDRAVQILLETDSNDSSYYSDALRACLIATVRSSGASQSTIKLVATNFIANGKLSEGIELLCLVDKGVDACRYLQTYGQWDLATWLAKVSLSRQDFVNILQRWADHLSSSHMNQKNKALMVMLSIGNFPKALEILYSLGHISRAVLLLESCIEFELLSPTNEIHKPVVFLVQSVDIMGRNLFENIFMEHARQMHKLGLSKAVSYYCQKAGGRGQKLLEGLGDAIHAPMAESSACDDVSGNKKHAVPSLESVG